MSCFASAFWAALQHTMPPPKALAGSLPPGGSAKSQESSRTKASSATTGSKSKKSKATAPAATPPKPQRASAKKSLVLRADAETESEKQGDLPAGTAVYILEQREFGNITRALIAMSETTSSPLGWVTMAKDGTENFTIEAEKPAAATVSTRPTHTC